MAPANGNLRRKTAFALLLIAFWNELLHSPISSFTDIKHAMGATGYGMSINEFAQLSACSTECTQDMSVKVEFFNLVRIPVHHEHMRVRSLSNAHPPGRTDIRPLCKVVSVIIEHLNPVVFPVCHVDVPVIIRHDRVRQVEFPRPRPAFSPCLYVFAILVVFDDAGITIA